MKTMLPAVLAAAVLTFAAPAAYAAGCFSPAQTTEKPKEEPRTGTS